MSAKKSVLRKEKEKASSRSARTPLFVEIGNKGLFGDRDELEDAFGDKLIVQ